MEMATEKYSNRKTRLIVQKGVEFIALRKEDIALFYTQNRLVHVVDKDEKKYILNKKLSGLEEELDPRVFFRINRQAIINIDFIKSFRPYQRVKIIVDLSLPNLKQLLIISQETAPAFRKWIHEV